MEPSPRWTLNREDTKRWLTNTAIFIAPVALIYFASVQQAVQADGLQLADFRITAMVAGAIVLYIINALTDLFRKFVADK